MQHNLAKKSILSIISGASLTLAFAPFHIWIIALIVPAILYALIYNEGTRRAALIGWLFGVGFFGTCVSWVYVSISTYGPPDKFLAVIITILFICCLAIFFLILATLTLTLFPHESNYKRYMFFPALWVSLEIIRSKIFTGFPWALLGVSQTTYPLSGYTPVFGVYITSLCCVLISACIFSVSKILIRHKKKAFSSEIHRNNILLNIYAAVGIIIIGWGLYQINWTKPTNKQANIVLVQGNIKETDKWDPAKQITILKTYINLSSPYLNKTNQLIFWPENAIPVFKKQAEPFLKQLNQLALKNHNTILTGIPIEKNNKFYNGATTVGAGAGEYLKQHLVPFGEYMPLQDQLAGIMKSFSIPMSDFVAGPKNQPLIKMDGFKIRLFNCFESAFPQLVANQLNNADFIVTISDDSWFGHSIGPSQHQQLRQTRALETGKTLVSATNNGITSVISPKGVILEQASSFIKTVLHKKINIYQGNTPWLVYKMLATYIIIAGLILTSLIYNRKYLFT